MCYRAPIVKAGVLRLRDSTAPVLSDAYAFGAGVAFVLRTKRLAVVNLKVPLDLWRDRRCLPMADSELY